MADTYISLPEACLLKKVGTSIIDDSTTSTTTTWSSSKIEQELNNIGDIYVRYTKFESVSSGTSGTITLAGSQQVILDDFGGTTDAIISKIEGGRPTYESAFDTNGNVLATTFDGLGNYTLSGTPLDYPIALVYRLREPLRDYDDTDTAILTSFQLEIRVAAKLEIDKIAGENISALNVVRLNGANSILKATNNGTFEEAKAVGIALNAATTGNNVKVAIVGVTEDGSFSFPSVGDNLYLGIGGVITDTAPAVGFVTVLGAALGTGAVHLNIDEPIEL